MFLKLTPVAKPIKLLLTKNFFHFLLLSKVVLFIINDFYTSLKHASLPVKIRDCRKKSYRVGYWKIKLKN